MRTMESGKPTVRGKVVEVLPATTFKIEIETGEVILAYLSGKMRLHYIKIMLGDSVLLELGPDGKRGRIIRRL